MQITSTKIDNTQAVEFYKTLLLSNTDEKMVFVVESKDIPGDDSHIYSEGAELQVIYGGGEDIDGAEIKDFSFSREIAGATLLEISKK